MSLSLLLTNFFTQVKRRLQEVILQRKRREAAASMGNLPTLIPGPPGELSLVHTLAMLTSDWSGAPSGAAAGPPTALLRKVQSESNLLKIKNRRERAGAGAPYSHRGANMHGNNILPKVSIDSKFIFTLPCIPPRHGRGAAAGAGARGGGGPQLRGEHPLAPLLHRHAARGRAASPGDNRTTTAIFVADL